MTEAGWKDDPTKRHELRYHDGSKWTDNVSDRGTPSIDTYEAVTAAPVPSKTGVTQKAWFKWAAGGFIGLCIGAAAGGSSSTTSTTTETTTVAGEAKTVTATETVTKTKTVKAKPSAAAPVAESTGPKKNLPIQDGDWKLISLNVKDDGLGDFGGTARITYTGSDAAGAQNIFTISLFKGDKLVGSLQGSAEGVKPGDTETVQLISQDKFVGGTYKIDFQNDI